MVFIQGQTVHKREAIDIDKNTDVHNTGIGKAYKQINKR